MSEFNFDTKENSIRNQNKKYVISLFGKTENGFTTIYSDYTPSELALIFEKIPEDIKKPLIDALKNTELDFSNISKEQIQAQIQEVKEKEELLKKANEIGQKETYGYGKFTKEEAYSIIQGNVGYTNPTSKKPILGTYGARPCIIVAMRNPKTQETALVHIDASLDQNRTLNNIISTLQGSENEKLEVHLRGGDSSSKEQAQDLLKYLSERNDVEIKSCNLITNLQNGANLAIDSRTGEIFTDFQVNQLEGYQDAEKLLKMHEISSQIIIGNNRKPAKIQFDGRKSENQKIPQNNMSFSNSTLTSPNSTSRNP